MNHLGLGVLTYAACALQAGAAGPLAVAGVAPHFLLLALTAALMTCDGRVALVWAAGIGLLSDCAGADRLGIDMLCAVLAALAVRRSVRLRLDSPLPKAALVAFAVIFSVLLGSAAIRLILVPRPVEVPELALTLSGAAAYSTLLGCTALAVWRVLCTLASLRPAPGRAG